MSTVLAALDDSAAASPVLTAAAALAPLLASTVQAVHVGGPHAGTARACADQAGVPYRVLAGDPAAVISRLAADGVSAVVVGARARPVGRTAVGHLALELAEVVPTPLLVVPPQSRPAAVLRSVLVALEGTPGRPKTLRHALSVVAGADIDVAVVHVESEEDVPSFSDSAAHETEAYAREFLARYWPQGPRARLVLRVGSPAEQILSVCKELHPDLLVAGWPQGRGSEHGHVVREVLSRSPVPLLLVATA